MEQNDPGMTVVLSAGADSHFSSWAALESMRLRHTLACVLRPGGR